MDAVITCPLCSQPGFSNVDTLRLTLISASTRRLVCPICQEVLLGLDKLTIHLVSHSLHDHLVQACFTSNVASPLLTFLKGNETVRETQNQLHIPLLEVLQTNPSSSLPQYILFNVSSSEANQVDNVNSQSSSKPQEVSHTESFQKTIDQKQEAPEPSMTGNTEPQIPCAALSTEICPRRTDFKSQDTQEKQPCLSFTSHVTQEIDSTSLRDTGSDVKEVDHLNSSEHATAEQETFEDEIIASEWTCETCGLNFKERHISLLHQQLVHDCNNQTRILNEETRLSADSDSSHPLKHRQKKISLSKQVRENSNSLHRFPCHLCSKVFRMRGSLMVHMRVAHSAVESCKIGSSSLSLPSSNAYGFQHTESKVSQTSNLKAVLNGKEVNLSLSNAVGSPAAQNMYEPSKSNMNTAEPEIKDRHMYIDHLPLADSSVDPSSAITVNDSTEIDFALSSSRAVKSPTGSPVWSPTSPSGNATIPFINGGGGVFSCATCNKTFPKESLLNQHLKSHEGKHWECDVCAKLFTTKYFLKKHKRLHTGKCFRQRVSYLVHRRIHTGAMPYQCTACLKSFRYKVSQRTHKCPAQPPGDVVQQPDDLLQRLLLCSLKQNDSPSEDKGISQSQNEVGDPHAECAVPLKEQLEQLNIKQEKNCLKEHSAVLNSSNPLCEPVKVAGSDDAKCREQDGKLLYKQVSDSGTSARGLHALEFCPKLDKTCMPGSSQLCLDQFASSQLWPGFGNQPSFRALNEDYNAHSTSGCAQEDSAARFSSKDFKSMSSTESHVTETRHQQSTSMSPSEDTHNDLLQDILSMVMSPSDSSSQSLQVSGPSEEHSEKYSWNTDPGEELCHLLYSPFNSQQ